MRHLLLAALTLAGLAGAGLVHAETAFTNANVELKRDAAIDAPTLATLNTNTALEVLQRRGAWTQVKSGDGKTGWVRMMSLRFDASSAPAAAAPAAAPGRPADNPLAALNGLLTPSRNNSAATVTTGVRGLDEADLEKSQPNANEFKKMQGFAASKNAANDFARTGKLVAQKVDYLKPDGSAAAAAPSPAAPAAQGAAPAQAAPAANPLRGFFNSLRNNSSAPANNSSNNAP